MRNPNRIVLFILMIFILFLFGCAPRISVSPDPTGTTQIPQSEGESPSQPQTIDGNALLETQCSDCHSLERVKSKSATADQWKITVSRMIDHGAILTAEEETFLTQYLAENFK